MIQNYKLVRHQVLKLFTDLDCIFPQAAELAEFTAKIALLEEAKRKKEDEATEWQHKVMQPSVDMWKSHYPSDPLL